LSIRIPSHRYVVFIFITPIIPNPFTLHQDWLHELLPGRSIGGGVGGGGEEEEEEEDGEGEAEGGGEEDGDTEGEGGGEGEGEGER